MRKKIEAMLAEEIRRDTPDCFDAVWEKSASDVLSPIIAENYTSAGQGGSPEIVKKQPFFKRHYKSLVCGTFACAAACSLAFVMLSAMNRSVAVVGLDVNPSIELSVDGKDKVIKADALNSDAETILGDIKLGGTDIDIAVNAVIGSMVRNNYLDGASGTVLVTVSGKDAQKAETLKQQVTNDVKLSLDNNNIKGEIINLNLSADVNDEMSELRSISEKYGISVGKAAFLQGLTDMYPQYTIKQLAPMKMEDIYLLCTENKLDLSEIADICDDHFDDDYVRYAERSDAEKEKVEIDIRTFAAEMREKYKYLDTDEIEDRIEDEIEGQISKYNSIYDIKEKIKNEYEEANDEYRKYAAGIKDDYYAVSDDHDHDHNHDYDYDDYDYDDHDYDDHDYDDHDYDDHDYDDHDYDDHDYDYDDHDYDDHDYGEHKSRDFLADK